jgi:hypothetical protein
MINLKIITADGKMSRRTRQFIEQAPIGVLIEVTIMPSTVTGNRSTYCIMDDYSVRQR